MISKLPVPLVYGPTNLLADSKQVDSPVELAVIQEELGAPLQHLWVSVGREALRYHLQRCKLLRLKSQVQRLRETSGLQCEAHNFILFQNKFYDSRQISADDLWF